MKIVDECNFEKFANYPNIKNLMQLKKGSGASRRVAPSSPEDV